MPSKRFDPGVGEAGKDGAGVRPGEVDGGGRGDDIGLRGIECSAVLDEGHIRRLDLRCTLLASGLRGAELAPSLVEQTACLCPRSVQFLNAVKLGFPAGEVGLDPSRAGPDFDELRLGACDVGLGHPDRGPSLLVLGDRLLDGRLFLLELGLQLGDRELREDLALLDGGTDVDVPVLDVAGDLGVERRGLERLELTRLAYAAADGLPLGMDDLDRSHTLR